MPDTAPVTSRDSQTNIDQLRELISRHATCSLGGRWDDLLPLEQFRALGLAFRDRLLGLSVETQERYRKARAKTVYYLSLEFLLGRSLSNTLANLGLIGEADAILRPLNQTLEELSGMERDAALGNGGLGRLAACFLDSLATMGLPAWGFGICYEYGLFRQDIRDCRQVEQPDSWLADGSPWLVERPERAVPVRVFGRVINTAKDGSYKPRWVDGVLLYGVPHDLPIVGYGGKTVNLLRLFSARAAQRFNMQAFNEGRYFEAVSEETRVETIHKVLYPNDTLPAGSELRLFQEYFLVACSIRTILNQFEETTDGNYAHLADHVALQMNDTHPALSVAELMRILIDDIGMTWEAAWETTTAVCAYTNHTLMPEALERWPVTLFERILPRHLDIIYEINRRHLEEVARRFPYEPRRLARASLIEEGPPKMVRMSLLAIVGSHSINGVAAVHSELVKTRLVPDFYALTPAKFNNKTNGVTPRRWLLLSNPGLAQLITEAIGDRWIADLDQLRGLEKFADDSAFRQRFLAVKRANKHRLLEYLHDQDETKFDDTALLDAQIKRIHLYKRQLLNVLRIVYDYLRLVEDRQTPTAPRTYLFAGKAAPAYVAAKEVIYLINSLGALINNDPRAKGWMSVVFAKDYRVTLAERIIPAADLSEQISTAGTEASGTSNMKFALNGALTMGTLDGANIEIRDEVGAENLFIFGKTVDEIEKLANRRTMPREFYNQSATVRRVMDAFRDARLSPGAPGRFEWVFGALVDSWDPYFHLADLDVYLAAQENAAQLYRQQDTWARKAILTVSRMGKFSSDRTIQEYARDIWNIRPVLDESAASGASNGPKKTP